MRRGRQGGGQVQDDTRFRLPYPLPPTTGTPPVPHPSLVFIVKLMNKFPCSHLHLSSPFDREPRRLTFPCTKAGSYGPRSDDGPPRTPRNRLARFHTAMLLHPTAVASLPRRLSSTARPTPRPHRLLRSPHFFFFPFLPFFFGFFTSSNATRARCTLPKHQQHSTPLQKKWRVMGVGMGLERRRSCGDAYSSSAQHASFSMQGGSNARREDL